MDSFEAVFYTFAFLVPGYIIECIIEAMMPMKRVDEWKYIPRCLGYSIFNHLIWFSWGYKLIGKVAAKESVKYWVLVVIAVFVSSAITGIIIGFIRASKIVYIFSKRVLGKFKINIEHPIPTAWEYYFSQKQGGVWVTVRMDNDKFIRGWFGGRSVASSDAGYRDIYIQEQFVMDEDTQKWVKIENTDGVWINADAIKHIEFIGQSVKEKK